MLQCLTVLLQLVAAQRNVVLQLRLQQPPTIVSPCQPAEPLQHICAGHSQQLHVFPCVCTVERCDSPGLTGLALPSAAASLKRAAAPS